MLGIGATAKVQPGPMEVSSVVRKPNDECSECRLSIAARTIAVSTNDR